MPSHLQIKPFSKQNEHFSFQHGINTSSWFSTLLNIWTVHSSHTTLRPESRVMQSYFTAKKKVMNLPSLSSKTANILKSSFRGALPLITFPHPPNVLSVNFAVHPFSLGISLRR